jgi:acyl-CoA synthetase (AMP-forming)/AMP-acid ligase II
MCDADQRTSGSTSFPKVIPFTHKYLITIIGSSTPFAPMRPINLIMCIRFQAMLISAPPYNQRMGAPCFVCSASVSFALLKPNTTRRHGNLLRYTRRKYPSLSQTILMPSRIS